MHQGETIIERCRELATQPVCNTVEAIIVGGSVGRGLATTYSDLDVFLLVAEGDLPQFLSTGLVDFASSLGQLMFARGPVLVEGFGYSFTVLYASYLVCQFNVNTHSMLIPNPMWNPRSRVVFDKTGFYTNTLADCARKLDESKLFSETFIFFWLRALTAHKYLCSNQLWAAISILHDLRNQMIILYRLAEGVMPPGMNFRHPAKGFERQLGGEKASELAQALCSYDFESTLKALQFCIQWFLEKSEEYVRQNGIGFVGELDNAKRIVSAIKNGIDTQIERGAE